MIELYSGVPGAGKSLHLALRLKSWMRYKKAPVIANFEFNALLVGCRGYGGFLRLENDELPFLAELNWFLPITEMIVVMQAWVAVILVYYTYSAIMRFIRLI